MQETLKLFQKIEVIKSSRQTKPGSIGYITSLNDLGQQNSLDVRVMFTRFGKSGKERLSVSKLRPPLIDIDSLPISENSKKDLEVLTNKVLMSKGIRYGVCDSKIKVIQEESKNLIDLDTWNFMAYISAISLFLSGYATQRIRGANVAAIDRVDEVKADTIGPLIYNMFRTKAFHPRLKEYIKYFDEAENRRIWLDELRKEMSIYRQIITRHHHFILSRYRSTYELIGRVAKDNGIKLLKLV